MSGETPEAVHDPWPQLREQWDKWEERKVQAAINDPMVQALAGLLPHCTGLLTPAMLTDKIEEYVERQYEIPSNRYGEVLMSAADAFIRREEEANGEA